MDKEQIHKQILQEFISPKKIPFTCIFNELSPADFVLITAIKNHEKENKEKYITVNELASRIGISVPAVSRKLKLLEVRKMIQRVTNEDNRRNTFVIITNDGEQLYKENKEKSIKILDKIIDTLSLDEIIKYAETHKKIEEIIFNECKKYN